MQEYGEHAEAWRIAQGNRDLGGNENRDPNRDMVTNVWGWKGNIEQCILLLHQLHGARAGDWEGLSCADQHC